MGLSLISRLQAKGLRLNGKSDLSIATYYFAVSFTLLGEDNIIKSKIQCKNKNCIYRKIKNKIQ